MKGIIFSVALLFSLASGFAKIKLPALVGDNMVLQRSVPLKIWGTATANEEIFIEFNSKKFQIKANEKGNWNVILPAQKVGGPFTMQIRGAEDAITLKNILIGDVWVCSGQSNMYFRTREAKNADEELSNANFPSIRLFSVPLGIATVPENDTKSSWSVCSAESVRNFSAVAYFFAKEVQSKTKIPIGLIQSAFGGTPVEAWISADGMSGDPQFSKQASTLASLNKDTVNKQMLIAFNKWLDSLEKVDPAYTNGKFDWTKTDHPEWKKMQLPAYFENRDKSLKDRDGIIWFSKSITLTEEDIQGGCSFNMGPVIDDDLVFINGVKIGQTSDVKYKSRTYKVPANVIHAGTNIIAIRVIDYGNFAGINGNPEQFYFKTPVRNISLAEKWNYKVSLDTVFTTVHASRLNQEKVPCLLYNFMIAPLTNYKIKGVLWYQGENNTAKAYQYRSLFKRLIVDWRNKFEQSDLPFLFVQLANFNARSTIPQESYWAELREAQAMALSLPETGMATAIDLGEATNIHPTNKQDVGKRLALLALNKVYDYKQIISKGPDLDKIKFNETECIIQFRNEGRGLKSSNGRSELSGFQVSTSGSDKFVFVPAYIYKTNTIKIISPDTKPITAVRYAWADNPGELNLINSAGLPAYPFRTDKFKEISYDFRYDEHTTVGRVVGK